MAETDALNLMMPGNPRYQPASLKKHFGYDNLFRQLARVEWANLKALAEVGLMPLKTAALISPELKQKLLSITTTQVDRTERLVTKHDVRAWVQEAQKLLPPELAGWVHVMLTSYDPLDTGRTLQYLEAHREAVVPAVKEVLGLMAGLVRRNADCRQIGRTHGQHALPITVGFWLANILQRMHYSFRQMETAAAGLVGKISGAVGAYNAQIGLGANARVTAQGGGWTYEERVLNQLGLKPAPISSQILPPEPLACYLHACVLLSASLGQFGRDCRQLMRSEIGEVAEEFSDQQAGSSTMAHKRNPITFENLEGTWLKTKNAYGLVLDSLISEHQRDLVGSSLARDLPVIVINLMHQLDSLRRRNKEGRSFLERLTFSREACQRNFQASAHLILSEPLYIALQMAGYNGDAHRLVNHVLVPEAQRTGEMLAEVAQQSAATGTDPELTAAWGRIPAAVRSMLFSPKHYIGLAREKALEIAAAVEKELKVPDTAAAGAESKKPA